jgi:hypothetical protein
LIYKEHTVEKVRGTDLYRTIGPDGERWLGRYTLPRTKQRISRKMTKLRKELDNE